MRIAFISDTHNKHAKLELPEADAIVHCGDFTMGGTLDEVRRFMGWYSGLPYKYKLFCAGNHDRICEEDPGLFKMFVPPNLIYLNEESYDLEGIKIFMSPIQPWFLDWSFNRGRGTEIARHWAKIPSDTQILVTHGPPYGILDMIEDGSHVGCFDLLERIKQLPFLKIFACGHIHESFGQLVENGVRFINASMLNEDYKIVFANKVPVIEI